MISLTSRGIRLIWRWILSIWRISIMRLRLKYALFNQVGELRIIVGASATAMDGWVSTEYPCIDISSSKSITRYFKNGSVSAIVAEHVLEHLTPYQVEQAAQNLSKLLKTGGRWRIAVPDGYHPDINYINQVKPNGTGEGSDDHKVLYNIDLLTTILNQAGFIVRPLEWFDDLGQFHHENWLSRDGYISRSIENDERNKVKPLSYTSLIVDAIKP